MSDRIKKKWEIRVIKRGMGGGGGSRNDLLPCSNADQRVGVAVKWWRSLRLESLVRGDDIYDKVSDYNHSK